MGCSGVVELLTKWALRGELEKVVACYRYYVENVSKSDIAHELGVTKHMVAGWVQRLAKRNGETHCRPFGVARILRELLPELMQLAPPTKRKVDPEHVLWLSSVLSDRVCRGRLLSVTPGYFQQFQHFQPKSVRVAVGVAE